MDGGDSGVFSADMCIIKGGRENKRGTHREKKTPDIYYNHTIPHLDHQPSMPDTMESAISVLVLQFQTFAGKDGSSNTLSKEEFASLVASELPSFVKNASDPAAIDQLMGSLDENNDGELTFLEFWQLIGQLASRKGGFSQ